MEKFFPGHSREHVSLSSRGTRKSQGILKGLKNNKQRTIFLIKGLVILVRLYMFGEIIFRIKHTRRVHEIDQLRPANFLGHLITLYFNPEGKCLPLSLYYMSIYFFVLFLNIRLKIEGII